jgi:hypothetical protein
MQEGVGDLTERPGSVLDARTRRLVGPIVAAKVLTLLAIWACLALFPDIFAHRQYIEVFRGNYGHPPPGPPDPSIAFATWDATHYVELAEHGYGGQGAENALYPLYPLVLRVLRPLFGGDTVFAGLVVSNIAGVLALLVLHDWLLRRGSARVADGTVLLLCVQPAAFFGSLVYAESLFLLLVALMFNLLDRGRPWAAGTCGALLALTRPVGVFVVVPLAIALLRGRRRGWVLLSSLLPCVGWLAYLGIVALGSGDPWLGFRIQNSFLTTPSVGRLLDPLAFFQSLFTVGSLHAMLGSALDRLGFLWFVVGVVLMARTKPRSPETLAYAVLVGLVPAVTVQLMCYLRYFSLVFPAFEATSRALDTPSRRPWLAVLAAACLVLQALLLLRHVNYRWAG